MVLVFVDYGVYFVIDFIFVILGDKDFVEIVCVVI